MKTAEELFEEYSFKAGVYPYRIMYMKEFRETLKHHDKELTAKIKELKEEETNFHAIEVLDKIIKMVDE